MKTLKYTLRATKQVDIKAVEKLRKIATKNELSLNRQILDLIRDKVKK